MADDRPLKSPFSTRNSFPLFTVAVLDMQMISDGVVNLLATTINELADPILQTVKIISCLGYQVEESTIEALDLKNTLLSFNMLEELPRAIEEGILEKAGPLYQVRVTCVLHMNSEHHNRINLLRLI